MLFLGWTEPLIFQKERARLPSFSFLQKGYILVKNTCSNEWVCFGGSFLKKGFQRIYIYIFYKKKYVSIYVPDNELHYACLHTCMYLLCKVCEDQDNHQRTGEKKIVSDAQLPKSFEGMEPRHVPPFVSLKKNITKWFCAEEKYLSYTNLHLI